MAKTDDIWAEWRDWVTRSGQQQLGAWRTYAESASNLLGNRATPVEASRAYLRVARDEGTRYVRELTTLGVRYASDLAELNRRVAETLSAELASAPRARDRRQTANRRIAVSLKGPLDGVAKATFTIANPQSTPATVSFTTSAMRGGPAPFHPELTFSPTSLQLSPGEERPVTVEVPLAAGDFEAGRTYDATVDVHGSDPLELALTVTVDAAS